MEEDLPPLFDLSEYPLEEKGLKLKDLKAVPIWTENKAALIHRYLRYFVFITKHGTYIDAFAGPQKVQHPTTWAAKMVLESEPKWMRNFAFFELNTRSVKHLAKLIASQGDTKPKRFVHLFPGDANVNVPQFLADKPIKPKEATFCLLDQRTFECDWATVTALANHKSDGNKIELFYFLAQGWIDRAISGLRKQKQERMDKWWGNAGWRDFTKVHFTERGRQLAERFKKELNYRFAYSYPIYERNKKGGKTMFWMTHASDHPEAPKLMVRAYNNVIAPLETIEQLTFEFGGGASKANAGNSIANP